MTVVDPAAPAATGRANPKLAEGVELIGEYEGSGFKEPPSLARRADGQVIQLPPLLYCILARADGTRDYRQLADGVGEEIQRTITPDQIGYLVEEKLRPLGLLTEPDGSSPVVEKPDPFLALRFRTAVIPERVSGVLGGVFRPLFFPPFIVAALAAFIAGDIWLFFFHGVAQALRQSIQHPGLFLPLFLAVVVFAAFHEIGHAAACRYGGGHPGKMGCGIYLAWPAFYTDVTDAYRLGRRARLRTDLGGVYFNVWIVVATYGAYALTHAEPVLLLVLIECFEIVHQLLPVIRLDGYYIVSDITGVPDLFARIGPILRSLVPGRAPDEKVTALRRWVRVAVTAWVLIVVPLLLAELLIVLIHLPRLLASAWSSGDVLWGHATRAFSRGDVLGAVSNILQVVVLAIPVVGILLMLVTTARKAAAGMWRHTEEKPVLRAGGALLGAAGAVALLYAWVPTHNYTPIKPGERGTVAEGVAALRRLPSGSAPLYSERVAARRAAAVKATHVGAATQVGAGTTAATSTTTTSTLTPPTSTARQRIASTAGGSTSGTTPVSTAVADQQSTTTQPTTTLRSGRATDTTITSPATTSPATSPPTTTAP